ncbi:hypothetical protein D3C72_2420390 [compost metagenome]
MWKIDGGFACYVVLARDTFEVKVEKRLEIHGHISACDPWGWDKGLIKPSRQSLIIF